MASELSEEDCSALMRLEEAVWREETRFDKAFMERALAPDFFELGKVLPTLAGRSRPLSAIQLRRTICLTADASLRRARALDCVHGQGAGA
jgi:hypothetical protein